MSDRGALVQDLDVGAREELDDGTGAMAGSFDCMGTVQ